MLTVRDAVPEDAGRLLEIYGGYVTHTAVSFEYDPPSPEEFRRRMETIMGRYPYLVILRDGHTEGYAYADAFSGRAAYGWSCETTIYLDRAAHKCGMGRLLYEALEDALRAMGILNLYACVAVPDGDDPCLTTNSADFHAHMGYRKAGEFRRCGYKFGRWYNMIWMEKLIGEHGASQPPVKTWAAVKKARGDGEERLWNFTICPTPRP